MFRQFQHYFEQNIINLVQKKEKKSKKYWRKTGLSSLLKLILKRASYQIEISCNFLSKTGLCVYKLNSKSGK